MIPPHSEKKMVLGRDEVRALKFLIRQAMYQIKHPNPNASPTGWYSYYDSSRDRKWVNSLEKKNLISVDRETKMFRLNPIM